MLRRKLAALLAGAMVLTSLPMVSFAKTDNNINRVPVVKDDHTFTSDAPILTIKKDPHSIAKQTFRLEFDNAEWKGSELSDDEVIVDDDLIISGTAVAGQNVVQYTYKKLTDTSIQVTVGNLGGTGGYADELIRIPMLVEMGDEGEATVTVNPMDSTVSAGTYTFAVAGSGDTTTTIEKVEDISSGDEIKPIEIQETKIGVFGTKDQEIELRLPSHFEWDKTSAKVSFSGGLADYVDGTYALGTKSDGKILTLSVKFKKGRTSRGSIILSGLKVEADNDARYGNVDVKVSGEDVTDETITVANYVDYQVSVSADGDPKEIFAGRYESIDNSDDKDTSGSNEWSINDYDDAHKLQKLIIEEDVVNSWLTERTTTISFPSWVQILGYKVDKEDKIKTSLNKNDGDYYDAVLANNADENEVTFTADETKTGKKKLEITFFVSVEGDATGDITATVSGRALGDEYEVVLGKAVAPVTASVDVADVRIGRQSQELGNITITETKEGAIKENQDLMVKLPDGFEWTDTPTVEVTEGDLEIDTKNVKIAGDDVTLIIPVDTDSREASTITISDISVDLDRTIPEGTFEFELGGKALVQNDGSVDEYGQFRTEYVSKVEFANVVTPNTDDLSSGKASAQKASFTVGSADYVVGAEAATADAAPYIQDGRTMIPVKYAAYALGVDPANVKWDQATKTVTILGDRVIQIKIGSKDLVVNGATLTMDVAAEVVEGRTYLPISWIASALNVPYSWDDATKTVTFN